MFSTLLGPLPADPERPATPDDVGGAIDAASSLAAVGLELVSDGALPSAQQLDPSVVVARWVAVSESSGVAVKAVLRGPFSATRTDAGGGSAAAAAEALRPTLLALAAAGCPIVEIAESDALAIATDAGERATFVDAHRRLVDGTDGVHVSLALTGGNVDTAGAATFYDLPYASYAFDLIAGPDNWRLITAAPGDRGIVCGALDPRPDGDETPELLVWAAHYAASTNGRGLARVGLANASSLAPGSRDVALRKLRIVAEAARIAAVESATEMVGLLDPRAVDPRAGARAGSRFTPARRRRP